MCLFGRSVLPTNVFLSSTCSSALSEMDSRCILRQGWETGSAILEPKGHSSPCPRPHTSPTETAVQCWPEPGSMCHGTWFTMISNSRSHFLGISCTTHPLQGCPAVSQIPGHLLQSASWLVEGMGSERFYSSMGLCQGGAGLHPQLAAPETLRGQANPVGGNWPSCVLVLVLKGTRIHSSAMHLYLQDCQ